jgi:hypothetical protein
MSLIYAISTILTEIFSSQASCIDLTGAIGNVLIDNLAYSMEVLRVRIQDNCRVWILPGLENLFFWGEYKGITKLGEKDWIFDEVYCFLGFIYN